MRNGSLGVGEGNGDGEGGRGWSGGLGLSDGDGEEDWGRREEMGEEMWEGDGWKVSRRKRGFVRGEEGVLDEMGWRLRGLWCGEGVTVVEDYEVASLEFPSSRSILNGKH